MDSRSVFAASTSQHQQAERPGGGGGGKSLKITKQQKGGNSSGGGGHGGHSGGGGEGGSGGSLLRQQLQGSLCSTKYRRAQETLCRECNKPFTAKCLLKVIIEIFIRGPKIHTEKDAKAMFDLSMTLG